jgi:uncharacterized protein (DUF1501 family)
MKRRNFLQLTATSFGGLIVLPEFLRASSVLLNPQMDGQENILLFIQLNGGNDGLNTFIPYANDLYYANRPSVGIKKDAIINPIAGIGFHPALKDLATISQNGHLSIIQNVGYPNPNRSHFRSQEIWQTATDSDKYTNIGWLGRFLDIQCNDQSLASLNIDGIDNLALKSESVTGITIKDFERIKQFHSNNESLKFSTNPQLDFVRKIAYASGEGMEEIAKVLSNVNQVEEPYANNALAKNLAWMAKLIKGNLASKIYYTSLSGFDTHNNQLQNHQKQLSILNDAIFSFYKDMKKNGLLNKVTVVVFSEFGRRVQENGSGTDHGTAGPMMIIGGSNKGKVIGSNPNLETLNKGDLIHEIDFRSVYTTLLKQKFNFDAQSININQSAISGLF